MNRSELVAALSERAEVTRKDADAVLAALAETVGEVVSKGDEKVTIPGFLTFERTHRAARTARNPQTGDPIEIPAGYSVKVSAGLQAQGSRQGQVSARERLSAAPSHAASHDEGRSPVTRVTALSRVRRLPPCPASRARARGEPCGPLTAAPPWRRARPASS